MERTQNEIINITTRDTIWEPEEGHEVEEKEVDPDGGNQRLCHLCTLPIFSTPYETKEAEAEGEDRRRHHFLHKSCAKLPQTLTDHPLHRRQPLHLHHLPDGCSRVFCHKCRRECDGFFYQCLGSRCKFTLDILCAVTVKILHRSHKHELTLICGRENRFTCSACGLEHKGEFYLCDVCGFFLHRDCALLPNAIVHKKHGDGQWQQHPLVLSFAFPENALRFKKDDSCSICHESLLWDRSGIYFCTKCSYTTHVKCAISDPHDFLSVPFAEAADTLIHFPMIETEHTNLVQYLLNMERDNKYWYSSSGGATERIRHLNKVFIEKIHHHELIFHENDDNNQHSEPHFCNACIYPIYPPFYTCPQSQCTGFYLHHSCANLPLHYHHPSMHYVFGGETCRDRPLKLLPRFLDNFLHIFKCSGCNWHGNGFVYGCEDCSVQLDLICVMLPEAITYQKHSSSHILLLSRGGLPDYLNMCHSCKCFILQHDFYYECCSCPNFKLDFKCVLLALTVSLKYDRHPLHLASPEFSTPKEGYNNKDVDGFCEICEEVMNDQGWFYQCKECATSFHTHCIPFAGGEKNCQIGETVRVRCHDCRLTSISMLSNYSYLCDLCKKTVQGKEDKLALECAKCGYWLHWECAKEQWIGN